MRTYEEQLGGDLEGGKKVPAWDLERGGGTCAWAGPVLLGMKFSRDGRSPVGSHHTHLQFGPQLHQM